MAEHSQVGATSLPATIQYRSGRLNFKYDCNKTAGRPDPFNIDGTFRLILWGTSDAIAAHNFNATTWFEIKRELYPTRYTGGPGVPINADLNFDTANVVGFETVAIQVAKASDSYTVITVYPEYLYYSTTEVQIFDSAEGIGQFSWLATDGGQKG